MNKKLLAIIGGVVALIAIIVACIFIFAGGEDAYRSIKVFEIDGSCTVDRDGDTLDAFKNMSLSSGDSFTVGEGSFARLKLDDDKYVYLEANTKINLTATGTANDSKTMVYIERGSMLTEVKKKLSATSSYDIVTPNTTMSIRGTKTLTEVYEDVLGAIKTNAAVVEGQVSFKTIQKDSTGKAVIVTTDLSVGQGLGVTTDSKDLLSQEDVKHIADDGKTVDGQTAEETTHEELGTTLETPVFNEDFLTNIVAVLARSREEDIEEGFAAEDVTEEELNAAINILNDVIDGKVELPAAVEEYVVSQTQPYYDEPIYDTPVTDGNNDTTAQPQVESEPEQITDDTVIPEDSEDAGDDTFVVDGTGETIVGISDDADDNDAATTDDESDDEADAAEDEPDDETADDGSGEAEEDDKSDEGDDAAEDGDEEDTDDESDEEGEDKEDAEETEEEEKEEESEGTEDESEEQQEEVTSVPEESNEPESSTSSPSEGNSTPEQGTTTTDIGLSYNNTTWNVTWEPGNSAQVPVKVVFHSGNSSNSTSYDVTSLPTSFASNNRVLPGCQGSEYDAVVYPANEQYESTDIIGSVGSQYVFTGWYANESDAQNNDLSKRITEYTSSTPSTLYPGISRMVIVSFINEDKDAGRIVLPETETSDVIKYVHDEYEENNEIRVLDYMCVKPGTTITLPRVESAQSTTDHPYILMDPSASASTRFFCYHRGLDTVDIAGLYLSENRPSTVGDFGDQIYYASDTAQTITVGEENVYLNMHFVTPVEMHVAEYVVSGKEKYLKIYQSTSSTDAGLMSSLTTNGTPDVLPGGTQKWKVTKQVENSGDGTPRVNYYTLKTAYCGEEFSLPLFTRADTYSSQYQMDFLCGYRSPSTGLVHNYKNDIDHRIVISSHAAAYEHSLSTAQLVDWVYLDLRINVYGTLNTKSSVGENNPYVIPDDSSNTLQHGYKYAVNPIDLFTAQGQQPTAPFNFSTSSSTYDYYIFAPDDIVYPWSNSGSPRVINGQNVTEPLSGYSALSDYFKKSYAYVGAEGYRLAGYTIDYWHKNNSGSSRENYLLNESTSQSGYSCNGHPCLINGTIDSFATNQINIGFLQSALGSPVDWEHALKEPVKMHPIFVQANAVTAKLEYVLDSFVDGYDGTTEKFNGRASITPYYKLILEGIYRDSFEYTKLDLRGVNLSAIDSRGREVNPIVSQIGFKSDKWEIANAFHLDGAEDVEINDSSSVYSDLKLTLNITDLVVPDLEYQHNVVHTSSSYLLCGLTVNQDFADHSGNYRPSQVRVVPAEGEAFKYSCFIIREGIQGQSQQTYITRVFKSSDVFTPVKSDSRYNNKSVTGMLMDITGADRYHMGYYGGVIVPEQLVNENGTVDSATRQLLKKEITRTTSASNIKSFLLGESYQGYSGMFAFAPYTKVTIGNCAYARVFNYRGLVADSDYQKLQPQIGQSQSTIGSAFDIHDDTKTFNLTTASPDIIYDIPDGFVCFDYNGKYLVYIGEEDSVTVYDGGTGYEVEIGIPDQQARPAQGIPLFS